MKLSDFFSNAPKENSSNEVKEIVTDHRKISKGSVFFAIAGNQIDGHLFVKEALEKGALTCVIENQKQQLFDAAILKKCIPVQNVRQCLAQSAALFYKNPASKLHLFGVTGTNGKTTTAYLLEKLLTCAGKKVAVLGTVENRFGNHKISSTHTTPGPLELHSLLKQFKDLGADSVVMEVSSHALDQDRVYGLAFDATIFTNLTQDHLDYHKDMESYFHAKLKLFTEYESKVRIIGIDDDYGKRIVKACEEKKSSYLTYGKVKADLVFSDHQFQFKNQKIKITTNLVGEFNDQNLSAALATYLGLGYDIHKIEGRVEFKVPGRLQWVEPLSGFQVFVDYAHTPDALEKALKTLRPLCKQKGRLLCVFGCGGNRDKEKRPLMGAIAEKNADLVWITSDNPRNEDPTQICREILAGMKNKDSHKIKTVVLRQNAIAESIAELNTEDVLLIAGKGHETYQIIGSQTHSFDDCFEAAQALQSKKSI